MDTLDVHAWHTGYPDRCGVDVTRCAVVTCRDYVGGHLPSVSPVRPSLQLRNAISDRYGALPELRPAATLHLRRGDRVASRDRLGVLRWGQHPGDHAGRPADFRWW